MHIEFTKISDDAHEVAVERRDGSRETCRLNSRSFLFHDLAHLALEEALSLRDGFWGGIARGASLNGAKADAQDTPLAELLAGPMQILIKNDAPAADYSALLLRVMEDEADSDRLGQAIHARARHLKGLWKATHYGASMRVEWPDG